MFGEQPACVQSLDWIDAKSSQTNRQFHRLGNFLELALVPVKNGQFQHEGRIGIDHRSWQFRELEGFSRFETKVVEPPTIVQSDNGEEAPDLRENSNKTRGQDALVHQILSNRQDALVHQPLSGYLQALPILMTPWHGNRINTSR